MIGALVGGRIVVAQGALNACKVGLTVAIRYALNRLQFGPENKGEIALMDHFSHQKRLIPLVAKTYALQFAYNNLKLLYVNKHNDAKELHVLASGLKVVNIK